MKLLIFDWDGTLMDSGSKIVNCFHRSAIDNGLEPAPEKPIRELIGMSLAQAWKQLYPALDDAKLTAVLQSYRDYWIFRDSTPMPYFEYVEQGLTNLESAGLLLAVATGKSRAGLDRVLKESKIGSKFVVTRCADETRSKPHPQMLLEILDFCGVDADDAIMIGDTEFDMSMARNAHVKSLGVSYGYHSFNALQVLSDYPVQSSFKSLVDWLLDQQQ